MAAENHLEKARISICLEPNTAVFNVMSVRVRMLHQNINEILDVVSCSSCLLLSRFGVICAPITELRLTSEIHLLVT